MRNSFFSMSSARAEMRDISFQPTEFLAFHLNGMAYGVDMREVLEVRGYGAVANMRQPAAQQQRWLDVRGEMVPHLDMRGMLALPALEPTMSAVVVVLALDARLACFTADRVLGVRRHEPVRLPSRSRARIRGSVRAYWMEVDTDDGDSLRLLDVERILEAEPVRARPLSSDIAWTMDCAESV